MQAGLAMDIAIATEVLGWHQWEPGYVGPLPAFVVNTEARAIELCMEASFLALYGVNYPDPVASYRFSRDTASAAMIYKILPAHLQDWRMTPETICRTALEWKRGVLAA